MKSDKILFTIDVEEYFHAENVLNAINPGQRASLPSRVCESVRTVLELLREHNGRATFFVLGEVAERQKDMVREISQEGHEIASHGYRHVPLHKTGPQEFLEDLRRSVRLLEDITGQPCRGYRATSFSLSKDMPWFFDALIQCGIVYDSSVSLSLLRPSWHEAAREKHFEISPGIIELPVAFGGLGPLRIPLGGGYFRAYPYELTRWALKDFSKKEGMPVFYLHNWELDPGQPRLSLPLLSSIRHYLNLSTAGTKLKKLLTDFESIPVLEHLKNSGSLA